MNSDNTSNGDWTDYENAITAEDIRQSHANSLDSSLWIIEIDLPISTFGS